MWQVVRIAISWSHISQPTPAFGEPYPLSLNKQYLFLYRPQHFLYFFPLPQGQGAFRAILRSRETGSLGSGSCGICGLKAGNVEDSVTRPNSRSIAWRGTRTEACPIGSGIVRISIVTCCRPAFVQHAWRGVLPPRTGRGMSIHSMYCLSIISCKLAASCGVISTGCGWEIRSSIGRSCSRSSQRRVLTLRKTTPGSFSSHLRAVAKRLAELTVNTSSSHTNSILPNVTGPPSILAPPPVSLTQMNSSSWSSYWMSCRWSSARRASAGLATEREAVCQRNSSPSVLHRRSGFQLACHWPLQHHSHPNLWASRRPAGTPRPLAPSLHPEVGQPFR